MLKRQVAASAVAVLFASTLVALTHSSAAAASLDSPESDVITYQQNVDYLPGARTYVEKGVRVSGGGCRFEMNDRRHVSTGPQVLVFTEMSYQPKTCTRTVASAGYPPGAVPPAVAEKLAAGDAATAKDSHTQRSVARTNTPAGAPALAPAAAPYVGQGYLQVWFEDPIYIDLALTRSTLNWNWSYPDLLLAGTTYHQAYWDWFSISGWRLDRSNQQLYNDGDLALTDTIGHFSNPIFCLGDTTYADHFQTLFYAADGGYWGWSYDVQKSGGCSGPIQMPGFYSWAINVV
jgi:hypothetical protein